MRRLTNILILVALALLVYDVAALAQNIESIRLGGPHYIDAIAVVPPVTPSLPAAIPPLPGWWRLGSQYLPCAYTPYTTWADPQTGAAWFSRYDAEPFLVTPNHGGQYAGQGGPNHTDQYYGFDGKLYPVNPGDHPPPAWHYPGPPTAANICTQYLAFSFNTGQACPTTPDSQYPVRIAGNAIWIESWAVYKPTRDADCNAPQPTWTPTVTPTRTVPVNTPTPAPSLFTDWIYQAKAESLMAGCSATLFCPGDPAATTWQGVVSRGQMAVFLLKTEHGASYVPPKCTAPGVFTDVPCVTP
jgi:hypothetical protein